MKKLTKIVLALALGVTMLFAAVGCSEGVRLTSIAWGTLPSTEYTLNKEATEDQSIALLKFSITLTTTAADPDGSIVVTQENLPKGNTPGVTIGGKKTAIIVKDFSVATEGSRTATVTIGKFSLNFTYTVTNPNSDVVKGTGAKKTPYLISNAAQFAQILELDNKPEADPLKPIGQKHFKITSDIDLSKLPEDYKTDLTTKTADGRYPIFRGKIDAGNYNGKEYTGKNWKLMNYTSEVTTALSGTDYQPGLFFLLGTCTFENIDLVNFKLDNSSAAGAGFFGVGRYKASSSGVYVPQPTDGSGKEVAIEYTFKNINIVDSYMNTAKNSGGFVGYTYYNTDVTVDNCTIDDKTTLIGGADREIGGFIGSNTGAYDDAKDSKGNMISKYNGTTNTFIFNNCSNASTMIGKEPGALIGNSGGMMDEVHTKAFAVRVTNCKFTGKMYVTFDTKATESGLANKITNAKNKKTAPWLGLYYLPAYATFTNSSCAGATFIGFTDNPLGYDKGIDYIAVQDIATNNNLKFSKVAGATHYVASYNFYINGSTYAVTEEIEQPTADQTMSTTFGKPTAIYDSEHSKGKTANLATGVLLIPANFTVNITSAKSNVVYNIVAYNGNIPIASAKGVYKDFTGGMMSIVNK